MPSQQQHKAPKQQDTYVSRGKTLASSVQRLRGWVGSDPSRAPELADALVELTAHRLLGHAYAAAGPDAQEAVQYAAQLLTANGPIGPYTSPGDAVRYVTAVVHLAAVQVGMGLAESAGRTMASLLDVRAQLDDLGIELRLETATVIWALLAEARSALANADPGRANAFADAALARWAESPPSDDPSATFLDLDVERLASDARWAAGLREEAVGYLVSAKDRYDAFAGDRLAEPGRLGQPVLERLAEPLPGLYSATADRLTACGEVDLGSMVRRDLIGTLRTVEKRWGEPARQELAVAEAALAAAGGEQAGGAAAPMSWPSLSQEETYAVTPHERSIDPRALDADRRRLAAAWLASNRDEAQRQQRERRAVAQSEAERQRESERAAQTAEAERQAAERAEAEEAARLEAERAAAVEEAERQERKRRREERLEAHRLEVERREAEERETRLAELRLTDPAEAERLELERLQAELAELERAEAERAEAERAEQERSEAEQADRDRVAAEQAEQERQAAERVEQERQAVEKAEQERQAAEKAEQERLAAEQAEQEQLAGGQAEAERRESERREAQRQAADQEELAQAVREWQEAKASGGRRAARAATERMVDLLRPRTEADFATYGPQLKDALEELSRARLRAGDLLGSRAPAKEAKALADRLP